MLWLGREALLVPVASADAYGEFISCPALVNAPDVLFVTVYPFWEGTAIDKSANRTVEALKQVVAVVGGRPLVVAETVWPDAGEPARHCGS